MNINSAYKWFKYSGATVSVTLNPMHWRWLPTAQRLQSAEWPSPNEVTYMAGWLFLTVRAWVDNGDW